LESRRIGIDSIPRPSAIAYKWQIAVSLRMAAKWQRTFSMMMVARPCHCSFDLLAYMKEDSGKWRRAAGSQREPWDPRADKNFEARFDRESRASEWL